MEKPIVAHLTRSSQNAKTGPIPVSTQTADWCPNACPFKAGGCYAKTGPIKLHWDKVTSGARGQTWDGFLQLIRGLPKHQLWRYGQAGDLPGDGERLDHEKVQALAAANAGRPAIVFTHYDVLGAEGAHNRDTVCEAIANNLPVNLSANSLAHADKLAALDIAPVVSVVPKGEPVPRTTPGGRPVVTCLAIQKEGRTCADCGWCAKADRKAVIAFPAHGTRAKAASEIASR